MLNNLDSIIVLGDFILPCASWKALDAYIEPFCNWLYFKKLLEEMCRLGMNQTNFILYKFGKFLHLVYVDTASKFTVIHTLKIINELLAAGLTLPKLTLRR